MTQRLILSHGDGIDVIHCCLKQNRMNSTLTTSIAADQIFENRTSWRHVAECYFSPKNMSTYVILLTLSKVCTSGLLGIWNFRIKEESRCVLTKKEENNPNIEKGWISPEDFLSSAVRHITLCRRSALKFFFVHHHHDDGVLKLKNSISTVGDDHRGRKSCQKKRKWFFRNLKKQYTDGVT